VRCGNRKLYQERGSVYKTVDDFVAAKASDFNKSQQLSTSGLQQVQYQSVRNNKFQQVSIGRWNLVRDQVLYPAHLLELL
jgi:hypothetical protein